MPTSLDTLNNVGPKYRYRIGTSSTGSGNCDVILTFDLGQALGFSSDLLVENDLQNVQQSVRSYLRKQYPGDTTTISVKAHNRVRSIGGTVFNNTLPGKSAYFGAVNIVGVRDQKEIQFQYTGSFSFLLSSFATETTIQPPQGEFYYLRSPNGVPKRLTLPAV